MVSLEMDADNRVTLRFHAPYAEDDEQAYLAALKQIDGREAPFVMLTVLGEGVKLSQSGEREQALWFKASRARMNRRCKAMAIVRPRVTQHMQDVFGKLWEFPVLVTDDETVAQAFLVKAGRDGRI